MTIRSSRAALVLTTLGVWLAGCADHHPTDSPPTDPVAAALHRGRTVVVLIADPGRSAADRAAIASFPTGLPAGATPVLLSLADSRSRAWAAPYHPSATEPTAVALSPAGLLLSHADAADPVPGLYFGVSLRKGEDRDAAGLDADYTAMRDAVTRSPNDVNAREALIDFLLFLQNDREAIPHLDHVAHDTSADLAVRVRAWTELGRAHLWVGEPEKARHAAQALIAELGPRTPDAIAGGNLVRGLQDTKAKRYDRAGDELYAAVAASPQSPYGREAVTLLTELPHKGN